MNLPDSSMPLVNHLRELRKRLIISSVTVAVVFAGLWFFARDMHEILAAPLQALLVDSDGSALIATGIASPFLVPFKLTMVLAVLISVPVLLHQIWAFVSPGLYQHERKFAMPLLFSSIVLFYSGVAFCYFVVLPLVYGFFTGFASEGITLMPDIANHLDFTLKLIFAFGIAFEIPIATALLVKSGAVSRETLQQKRAYVFLTCFIIGMFITPPDMFSQTILAVPMYLLFEAGLIASRFLGQPPISRTPEDLEESPDQTSTDQ
ncbi:twin-arginine translocase subunit TatC [Salinibius halmophilus]|uniref:twin-arginine translocase subunit TatC n=1 Tax=Salinibius halmophilus TaxID=1853216 RepID=UPI001F3FCC7F|nr:twin-arginine translocase subunit TatC [Salinibius halmophilus]